MKMKISHSYRSPCCWPLPPPSATPPKLYAKNCASCHGKDGTGDTTMGKKAEGQGLHRRQGQAWFTDAEGLKAILEGKEKMKGYKDKVTEAEAKELVKLHPRLQEIIHGMPPLHGCNASSPGFAFINRRRGLGDEAPLFLTPLTTHPSPIP